MTGVPSVWPLELSNIALDLVGGVLGSSLHEQETELSQSKHWRDSLQHHLC